VQMLVVVVRHLEILLGIYKELAAEEILKTRYFLDKHSNLHPDYTFELRACSLEQWLLKQRQMLLAVE
jgi:hypothetical protein